MKPNLWVPCGIAFICMVLTANSLDAQDERSNNGMYEGEKLYYGNIETNNGEYRWPSLLQHAGAIPVDPCATNPCNNDGTCTNNNGVAKCTCKTGYTGDMCETAIPVDPCATNPCNNDGTCTNNNGVAKCTCKPGYTGDLCETAIPVDPCATNPCKNDGTCTNNNGVAKCTCKPGYTGNLCETAIPVDPCATNPCKNDGTCTNNNGIAKCTCKPGYTGDLCETATCSGNDDCQNKGTCEGEEGKKVCTCVSGTAGNKCETIIDCGKGKKYENCTGDNSECTFKEGAAVCTCKHDTKLDGAIGQCRDPCKANTDCENEAECKGKKGGDAFCDCKPGTVGDKCETITACQEGGKFAKCDGEDGECLFEKGAPTCNCTDDKALDENAGYCKIKFCVPNPCQDGSDCAFDEVKQSGVCICKEKNKYYDYFNNKCAEPDKCILKSTPCEENKECVKGECKCIKNYKMVNDTCEPNFCKPDPCFKGSTCDYTDGNLKCSCKEGEYFNGKKECEAGTCFLGSDFKKNCMQACPTGFKKKEKDKECEPDKGYTQCSLDCGYGYCVQKDGGDATCSCIKTIAVNLEGKKDGKCILKNDVCASKALTKDSSKCDCTVGEEYKLKLASNGITCELMTCLDDSAQNDCKSKGARCQTDAKKGYNCICPIGYLMDNNKKMCTDPCSLETSKRGCQKSDQFCYNSASALNSETVDCECPPTLKMGTKDGETKCVDLAQNVYTIHGIPVIKKRYEMDGKINQVLLNADLIQSMKSTFQFFDYGYLQDYVRLNDEVLNVSVWIQFNAPVSDSELNRIHAQTRTFEGDDINKNLNLWPPSVLLDNELLKGVESVPLTFCSEKSKNALCGKDAACKDNKCSCPLGFRTVEYSIRDIKDKFRIERCEDVDECATETHTCGDNTTCYNLPGDYYCQCKPNFKKEKDPVHSRVIEDKSDCYDLCTPNPCNTGTCVLKEDKSFDCKCPSGSEGSFCDSTDVSLASAKKSTAIVGSILGVILGLALIALFLLYRRMKQNSYSEDFSPASRQDRAAEMMERRPVRGMVNSAYE